MTLKRVCKSNTLLFCRSKIILGYLNFFGGSFGHWSKSKYQKSEVIFALSKIIWTCPNRCNIEKILVQKKIWNTNSYINAHGYE